MPKLLVFDLDGTLIDSSLDLCNSVNAALRHVSKPELPQQLISSYIGDGAAALVQRAIGQDDASRLFQHAYEYFLSYYHDHKLDNTYCYGGVVEALLKIKALHPKMPMAVLTNKPVKPSREICEALGLTPFFFQNYGGNSFGTKKPDPEGFLAIVAEASSLFEVTIDPAEAVMIGDSAVDVMTARHCGARSVGCSFGLAPEALAAADPDIMVASPAEWYSAFGL